MHISLQNCGKNFHRTWLFRGLSFEIPVHSPETTTSFRCAILGSNGSGKSTFTLLLAGQNDPTEGQIQWLDTHHKTIPQHKWHNHVALASPAMELPEEFTLGEWFDFHRQIRGFQSGVSLSYLLTVCGFPKSTATKTILTFSSGMKQRVKLCSALLGHQDLVILDEPLTNLDIAGNDVLSILIANHLNNRPLIIASNREDEWIPFCNHKYNIGESQISAL